MWGKKKKTDEELHQEQIEFEEKMKREHKINLKKYNHLIAQFMGAKKDGESRAAIDGSRTYRYTLEIPDCGVKIAYYDKDVAVGNDVRSLEFYTNWSWLMAIIDKIEGLKMRKKYVVPYCQITGGLFIIYKWGKRLEGQDGKRGEMREWLTSSEIAGTNTKKRAVFYTAIEFIKWYNKKTQ